MGLFTLQQVVLRPGDCREVLKTLPDASIDSVVTDPPYALVSVVQRFGNSPRNERTENVNNPYGRTGRGFMGHKWDTGETAFHVDFWREIFRVLKPGAHVAAFGGTRTYHRLAVAIEDAGFEIRDQLGWLYGTGFPKSHDVSKAIDKAAGAAREVVRHAARPVSSGTMAGASDTRPWIEASREKGFHEVAGPIPVTAAAAWEGWGTALKPAWEPIVLARKPLIGTVVDNVLAHGTGAINVGACRVPHAGGTGSWGNGKRPGGFGNVGADKGGSEPCGAFNANGRFPANVLHDGSDEVLAAFPHVHGAGAAREEPGGGEYAGSDKGYWGNIGKNRKGFRYGDPGGSASRFFYCAKASKADRAGSKHPTVKPISLMQWLVRLITPPGGTVLDPFAGSGTTGVAAHREGMRAILVEREPEYQADILRRLEGLQKPTPAIAAPAVSLSSHDRAYSGGIFG